MSYKINDDIFQELKHLHEKRLGTAIVLLANDDFTKASIQESFDCCGKAYFFNFRSKESEEGDQSMREWFEKAFEILKTCKYSAVSLIHKKNHRVIRIATEMGFKPVSEFVNKRSSNTLVEMTYIL